MNKVTSITVLTTAEGKRLSITHSQIDDSGNIISENNRTNRVIVDAAALEHVSALESYAETIVDNL